MLTFSLSTASSSGDNSSESGASANANWRVVTDQGDTFASGSISWYANGEGGNGYALASSSCSSLKADYLLSDGTLWEV